LERRSDELAGEEPPVDVTLAAGVAVNRLDLGRHFAATSSCGICARLD
jgi:hypothetical protein